MDERVLWKFLNILNTTSYVFSHEYTSELFGLYFHIIGHCITSTR